MKVYSTLRALESSLLETIENEERKMSIDGPSEKAKSRGVIDASRYVIFIIEMSERKNKSKRKIIRDQITPTLGNKINNCIYEMMKAENNYKVKATDRLEHDIKYYENMVETLQLIRDEIDKAFD